MNSSGGASFRIVSDPVLLLSDEEMITQSMNIILNVIYFRMNECRIDLT
jgi:hypothetical protein